MPRPGRQQAAEHIFGHAGRWPCCNPQLAPQPKPKTDTTYRPNPIGAEPGPEKVRPRPRAQFRRGVVIRSQRVGRLDAGFCPVNGRRQLGLTFEARTTSFCLGALVRFDFRATALQAGVASSAGRFKASTISSRTALYSTLASCEGAPLGRAFSNCAGSNCAGSNRTGSIAP